MGGCCIREQTQANEIVNSVSYSNEEIINTGMDTLSKSELKSEIIKLVKSPEETQLDLIINNIQNSFESKTKKISIIELYNLSIYFKEDYTESQYLIYDTRRSAEQKEDYLKKMNHINYTFYQIKEINGTKLENFQYFLNNKIIILIISERYLKKEKRNKTTPFEIVNLLFNINKNINIYILDSPINEAETPNIFKKLTSFLSGKVYEILPYILFCYRHVTTFYIDGYIFINFLNKQIFSFDSLINELRSEKKELNFKNKFLKDMNITSMINIDNNSQSDFKINEKQNKKSIYKIINCTKSSLLKYKNSIIELCNWLRSEVSRGHSIYINVENYNENIHNWIFVVITILTYIVKVEYEEIANYLKEKINFINDISNDIDYCLNSNEFNEIFDDE
jgi:hypothetical protein